VPGGFFWQSINVEWIIGTRFGFDNFLQFNAGFTGRHHFEESNFLRHLPESPHRFVPHYSGQTNQFILGCDFLFVGDRVYAFG
jgi:hypothetical protein